MSKKALFLILATASLALSGVLRQAAAQDMGGGMNHGGLAQAGAQLAEGVVRKVDKDAAKLTIKHGPLPNLDMPAMTMVYRVADPAMLDRFSNGDRIRFEAQDIGGQLTVVRIEPAP